MHVYFSPFTRQNRGSGSIFACIEGSPICQIVRPHRKPSTCALLPCLRCGRGGEGWSRDSGGCGRTKTVFSDSTVTHSTLWNVPAGVPPPASGQVVTGPFWCSQAWAWLCLRMRAGCREGISHSFIQDSHNTERTRFHINGETGCWDGYSLSQGKWNAKLISGWMSFELTLNYWI